MPLILLRAVVMLTAISFWMASPALCKDKGYDPKESFEDFSKKLNLTKEQKEKVRPILNEQVDKIKEVYREAREKEMRILQENRDKVMEVLTPQQQEKYRKMIADRQQKQQTQQKQQKSEKSEKEIPVLVTVVVAEPLSYYGKSVIAEGYVKRALTDDAFILSEAPDGTAEIVVVGAGPAVVQKPQKGQKVAVRGVLQNFKIDDVEKQLKVDLDEGIFGQVENKPGIFARWVKKQ